MPITFVNPGEIFMRKKRGTHSSCLFKKNQNAINEKMRIEQRKFHADVGGVVVVVGVPLLGGYLIPVDGQDPAFGASATRIKIIRALNLGSMKVYLPMGTNVPSMTDPFRLKYHSI